ncbi:cytochrome P450 6k1-like [Zophobas morio]|uniref:cytochrome P450 6k1-like n=1 Tax=Zophobas morio TaxID=2755281 RepID=UPI003083A8E3
MFIIYLGCLLILLYYFLTKDYGYWQSKNIPFEKPVFIFGSFHKIVTRKQHLFYRIREIYDTYKTPHFGIYIFHKPALVIRDPKLLKKVFVKDFNKFMNRELASNEKVDPLMYHSLFGSSDQVWKNLRTKLSPVFSSGKMKLMLPLMKECAADLTACIEKSCGGKIEVRDVMKRYAVDNISSCAFGINSYCLKNEKSEILEVSTKLVDFKSFVRNFSVFSFLFAPKFVDIFRLTFLDKDSARYLINVFKETIREREKKQILRNDLIDLLNNLKQNETFKEEDKFDDLKMAAQAIQFFSAGNDTTSITISYTLYELAINRDIQDRLRQEITEIFDKYGDFTYEAIQDMTYLDMVLNETLRKYPLTNYTDRRCEEKYTFEETGLTVDKNICILIPIAGLHYDPEYFPNPEKFDPERFSSENKHKIVPYTFLPFGEGPRNCIGQRFAILVSKVALAYSLKNFVFDRVETTKVPLELDNGSPFILNKGGLYLKVTKV